MKVLSTVAFALTIIGGLNWGLVGLGGLMGSNWNLVSILVGAWPMLEALVYVLVGLSALYLLLNAKKHL